MKKIFNIGDYIDKDREFVMHCPEKWMARMFCDYLHNIGGKWCSGNTYLGDTRWGAHGEAMCYAFTKGQYSSYSFYEDEGYEILEFSDFYWVSDNIFIPSNFRFNTAMHCPEKWMADKFLKYMESINHKLSLEPSFWDVHKEETCICYNHNQYASLSYFEEEEPDFMILEFSRFCWEEEELEESEEMDKFISELLIE